MNAALDAKWTARLATALRSYQSEYRYNKHRPARYPKGELERFTRISRLCYELATLLDGQPVPAPLDELYYCDEIVGEDTSVMLCAFEPHPCPSCHEYVTIGADGVWRAGQFPHDHVFGDPLTAAIRALAEATRRTLENLPPAEERDARRRRDPLWNLLANVGLAYFATTGNVPAATYDPIGGVYRGPFVDFAERAMAALPPEIIPTNAALGKRIQRLTTELREATPAYPDDRARWAALQDDAGGWGVVWPPDLPPAGEGHDPPPTSRSRP